ncbi:protein kinase domain-containing protein [Rhodococcus qingshengii]|uniref:protein kinase domain-containing protein n=1 Tax=Rhodococcus qingshengii TaxID=334542 RepID=UPI001C5E1083|nr:protein kinase [Rhodococcus qingshengii]MBW4818410.1 protein kinase [Rhodococcus qingshengii]
MTTCIRVTPGRLSTDGHPHRTDDHRPRGRPPHSGAATEGCQIESPSLPDELAVAGFDDAEEVGRGGFGVVYRCTQAALDRAVAIKVMTAQLEASNLGRFLREQRAMGRLSGHPNIVSVFQCGSTTSGLPYIAMQFHRRGSLQQRIDAHGALTWNDAVRLGVRTAGALAAAHRAGILHRDVKPANILLTDYGEPQLADFGIAHVAGGFETADQTVTGTLAYTAPEVLHGAGPTPAADVYALASTMFCAMAGHAAYERHAGEPIVAQFLRVTTQPIPDLRKVGVPDDVCVEIERAMSPKPEDRPPTAAEFGNRLRRVQRLNGYPVDEMALVTTGEPHPTSESPCPETIASPPAPALTVVPTVGEHAPSPSPGSRGNLPADLTTFVGRRHEVATTKKLLAQSRLVTLIGTGGVGKTRLASKVAAETHRTFADGVWLVELGELTDGDFLVDTVVSSLRIQEQPDQHRLHSLIDYLRSRRCLLVLDNCEHLIDGTAALAEALLQSCPDLRILATSREPLGLGGESLQRVQPLSTPDSGIRLMQAMGQYDAVRLFLERATAALPEFELTEENWKQVARVCEQLDGLPLAIELAAVRLRAISIDQIHDKLSDRYRLLSRGRRRAPARQQSLRLCIDWSHDLCTPQERTLWSRLSVFAGSFELDAAEAICADGDDVQNVLDIIASLVDKSILVREEDGLTVRYRMLDTLRDYGREQLSATEELMTLRRRHSDWYRQLAREAEAEWISANQLTWILRLDREHPNLRDALRFRISQQNPDSIDFATALYPFWFSRGLLREGRRWLESAVSTDNGRHRVDTVRALCAQSVLAGRQGDLPAGAQLLSAARTASDHIDDEVAQAHLHHAEGMHALYSGNIQRAATSFSAALATLRTRPTPFLRISTLQGLGLASGLLGDTDQAIARNEEAITLSADLGESVYRARSFWVLGLQVWQLGNLDRATGLLGQGLRMARVVDDPLSAAWCLEALAWIAAKSDRAEHAAQLMGAAEGLWESVGSTPVHIPGLHIHHDECARRAQDTLSRKRFYDAFHAGRRMTLADAVAFALDEDTPVPPAHPDTENCHLTKREHQVAELVAEGLTNRAIATRLVISNRTAQGHVEHILTKLGFTSRTQIAAWVAAGKQ